MLFALLFVFLLAGAGVGYSQVLYHKVPVPLRPVLCWTLAPMLALVLAALPLCIWVYSVGEGYVGAQIALLSLSLFGYLSFGYSVARYLARHYIPEAA